MLSVCLIVKNEEKWIADCIRHLMPMATEIIVADTGSTDRTMEILRTFPIKIYETAWEKDFGKARNFTIERATQPWIFSFDADEKISNLEIPNVLKQIRELDGNADFEAIQIIRRDFITNPAVSNFQPCQGDHPDMEVGRVGYYTEQMTRIFRRKPHIRWTGKIHEMIEPSLQGRVFASKIIFHHFGYLPEEAARKNKREFYQDYGQRKIEENPNDWKANYDLGIEYLEARKFGDSVKYFARAREICRTNPGISDQQKTMTLSNYGYSLMELKAYETAEAIMNECLAVDRLHHDTLMNLGVLMMRQQRFLEAVEKLLYHVSCHPRSFLGYRNLGLAYANLNDLPRAMAALREALRLFPRFSDAKLDVATICLMTRKFEAAAALAQEVLAEMPMESRATSIRKEAERLGRRKQPS